MVRTLYSDRTSHPRRPSGQQHRYPHLPPRTSPSDHLQFRVIQGDDFSWAYLTRGRRVIETTGLPNEKIPLSLDILLELTGVTEVVDQSDDRRLDELERDGLM